MQRRDFLKSSAALAALTGNPVHTSLWDRPGEVLHVSLAREADVAAVAPATANFIAKLAHGLADDLLTATLLEATCPVVLAPAMHSRMWEQPATIEVRHRDIDHIHRAAMFEAVNRLRERGFQAAAQNTVDAQHRVRPFQRLNL